MTIEYSALNPTYSRADVRAVADLLDVPFEKLKEMADPCVHLPVGKICRSTENPRLTYADDTVYNEKNSEFRDIMFRAHVYKNWIWPLNRIAA